jgi:peptidoglycan/LPS O-acetylase OafA/YrhL
MTENRAIQKQSYMPGLDGLRALAVFAVIGYHLGLPFTPGGFLGVTLFFVLSGYLITDILLSEWAHNAAISLKNFFIRRAKRLVPAILFLIICLAAYITAFRPDLIENLKSAALPAAFFFSNWWYIFNGTPYFSYSVTPSLLNHFWSLAVEAQFYLVWPVLLIALQRFVKKQWLKVALVALGAVLSAVLMAVLYQPGADPSRVYYGTDTRVFSLLLGAALAFALPSRKIAQLGLTKKARVILDVAGLLALLGVLLATYFVTQYDDFLYYGGMFVFSAAALVLIVAAVNPATLTARFFSLKPLRFIGDISYGVYLWQFPVIAITNSVYQSGSVNALLVICQVAATILLAAFSYYAVEKPIRQSKILETLKNSFTSKDLLKRWWKKAAEAVVVALVLVAAVGIIVVKPVTTSLDQELLDQPSEIGSDATDEPVSSDEPIIAVQPSVKPTAPVTPDASPGSPAHSPDAATDSPDTPTSGSDTSPSGAEISTGSSGTVAGSSGSEPGNPPDSPDPPEESVPAEAEASKQRVTLIGDSIGIDVMPHLKELYPELNAEAKEGRQFYEAKGIIKQLIADEKLAPTVVFVLGSNGLIKESLLKELIELIGSDRKIVFVNTQVPRSWCEGVNTMLTEVADGYPNAIIADWYTASIGKDDYFYNDNVHPNQTGSKVMAQVIAGAITKVHMPSNEEIAAAALPF